MTGPSRSALPPLSHRVTPPQAGRTLASVLRELLPELSWSRARQLCAEGGVRVDGQTAGDPVRRLEEGEEISFGFAPGEARGAAAGKGVAAPGWSADRIAIVHCDADVVVVRKPAGLLTVPFERDDRDTLLALTRVAVRRMESARRAEKGGAKAKGGSAQLRAVQRLDKETSGLVVFARNDAAQRSLQEQLAEHTMERRYLALVHGAAEAAIHDTLLLPDRGDGLKGSWGVYRPARGRPPEEGKQAVTGVSVVERIGGVPGATLVSCVLETGRQHQIRIHLAEAGHPVVGETVYVRDYRGKWIDAPRLMLHAAVLGFLHPRTTHHLRFEDTLPEEFRALMSALRRRARAQGKAEAPPAT